MQRGEAEGMLPANGLSVNASICNIRIGNVTVLVVVVVATLVEATGADTVVGVGVADIVTTPIALDIDIYIAG
jgi:hypothetical protein